MMNKKVKFLPKRIIGYSLFVAVLFFSTCATKTKNAENPKPNVVLIYLDDLGYGDVSAYGAAELKTPNMDMLANGGVRFTQGYSTSSTCTPSRYGLLTGVYPWRNNNVHILSGSAPLIIDTTMITLPKMMKAAGYHTGIVGKWHLGLGDGNLDWNGEVTPGPNQVGFDYSVIMAATQDRVPTIYIENGYGVGLEKNDPFYVNYKKNFEGEPTGETHPELVTMKTHHGHNNSIVNGIPRIGFMKGGKNAYWNDVDIADYFLDKAKKYVKLHKDEPFFLYYALQQPHQPRTPHPRFVGTTTMGPRGDVIIEADWCIGEFIKTLEEEGLMENTLIIFSSDNGPVLNDGYYDDAVEKLGDHKPTGPLRGGKYSLFEAGMRVPFVTYWKGTIEPKVSDTVICQIDLINSVATLLGVVAPNTDSKDVLTALLGKSDQGRENLVIGQRGRTAYRKGDWIYIPAYPKRPRVQTNVNIETGCDIVEQLYNLKEDIGQQHNLAENNPGKLDELRAEYNAIINAK